MTQLITYRPMLKQSTIHVVAALDGSRASEVSAAYTLLYDRKPSASIMLVGLTFADFLPE